MLQFWAFALGRRFDVNLVALGAADEPEGV
jgi:hypothetical protein